MKKFTLIALFGALIASCCLKGGTLDSFYKMLFNAINRKPEGSLLVVNVSQSYVMNIMGASDNVTKKPIDIVLQPQESKVINIAPKGDYFRPAGDTITIVALKKDTGERVTETTYTRGEKDDLLEIDAGYAPNFPELKGSGIGARTWMSGRVSPYVRIWLRESFTQSIQQVYPAK
jgi:hypothetical protein